MPFACNGGRAGEARNRPPDRLALLDPHLQRGDIGQIEAGDHRGDPRIGADNAAIAVGLEVEAGGELADRLVAQRQAGRVGSDRRGDLWLTRAVGQRASLPGPAKGLDTADNRADFLHRFLVPRPARLLWQRGRCRAGRFGLQLGFGEQLPRRRFRRLKRAQIHGMLIDTWPLRIICRSAGRERRRERQRNPATTQPREQCAGPRAKVAPFPQHAPGQWRQGGDEV